MRLAKVLIEHPIMALDLPFDYLIPENMNPLVGVRVEVENCWLFNQDCK